MEQILQQLLERVDSSRRDLVQLSNNLDLIRMDLVTCIQSVASQPPPPVPLTNSAPVVKVEEDSKPALKTINQSTVIKIKTERKKDVCNCPNFPGHSGNNPSGHHHHAPKKTQIKQSIVKDEMPSIPSIPPNQVAVLLAHSTGGGGSSSTSNSDTRPAHSNQGNQAISDNNLLSKGQVNINTDSDNTNQLVVCEGQEIVGQVSNEANDEGSEGDDDADGDDETVIDTSGEFIEAEQNENEQKSRSVVGEPSNVKRMPDGRESNDEVNSRDVGVDDEVGNDNKVIRPGRKRPLDSTKSSTAPSTQISLSTKVNLESASNSGSNKRLAVVGLSQSQPSLAQPTGPLESDDDDESSVDGRDDDSDDDDDYNGEEEETDIDEDTDEDDDEDGNLKPFLCPYEGCEKRYTRKGDLTRHSRSHTGEKPYKCPIRGCGRRFGDNSNLNRHVRVHTGERPFVCDRCGKSFSQKDNLNVHFLTHTTERPFVCGIFECNKTFKSKNDLHLHQRKVLHRAR